MFDAYVGFIKTPQLLRMCCIRFCTFDGHVHNKVLLYDFIIRSLVKMFWLSAEYVLNTLCLEPF